MKKTAVGVIGLGMGRTHIGSFAQTSDRIEVAAVADINKERLKQVANEFHIKHRYIDYRRMLQRDDIEVVIICTPNFLHAPMAVETLEAGKHALIEKPPANSVEGVRHIAEVAARTGRRVMYALCNRFREDVRMLKKIIDSGDFGQLYFAKAGWVRRNGIPFGSLHGWFCNREKAGGGPMIDLGVHVLDLAWWLLGNPKPIAVSGSIYNPFIRRLRKRTADVEDFAAGFIRFDNGASLFVEASWAGFVEKERFYVDLLGTKSGVSVDLFNSAGCKTIRMFTKRKAERYDITFPEFEHLDWSKALTNQLLHLIECIRKGRPNMAGPREGLQLMQMIDGLYRSAAAGHEVSLDSR